MSDDYYESARNRRGTSAMTEAERVHRLAQTAAEKPEWVSTGQLAADWLQKAVRDSQNRNASFAVSYFEKTTNSISQQFKHADATAKNLARHFAHQPPKMWTSEQKAEFEAIATTTIVYSAREVNEKFAPEVEKEPAPAVEKQVSKPVIQKIEIAPGYGTLHFLGRFCQKNFRERVLEALHSEAIADYEEALKRGDKAHATSVRYMMHVWMVGALFGGIIGWAFGKLSFKIGSGE
jgi:hypothetical protein